MDMLDIMHGVERALPRLLLDREGWTGVFADSEKPHLRRLWRQHGKHRINLHFFDGMEAGDQGFAHPHPWPFAVRIHEGRYLMEVGRGPIPGQVLVLDRHPHDPGADYAGPAPGCSTETVPAQFFAKINLGPGDEYEMGHPDGIHLIRPLERIAKTLMVSGPPIFPKNRVRSNKIVRMLTTAERDEMIAYFAGKYPYLGDDATA